MSLIDLHGIFWMLIGVITGPIVGAKYYGIIGGLLGIPIGLICGIAALYTLSFIFAFICKLAFGGPLFPPKIEENTETPMR